MSTSPKSLVAITCGYRRDHIRLQAQSHTVTGAITYGYRRDHIRLQARSHAVTGNHDIRLQARSHAVAGTMTYGHRLHHIRLRLPAAAPIMKTGVYTPHAMGAETVTDVKTNMQRV